MSFKISCFLTFIIILLFSCKKQELPDSKFNVTATRYDKHIFLKWNPFLLSGFKNISIYRSASPIPDPTLTKAIDANLLIGSITDNNITSFTDSLFSIPNSGIIYYKAVLYFNNRFLVSDQLEIVFNSFSIYLPLSYGGSSFVIAKLPEINILYFLNASASQLSRIDYSNKKIISIPVDYYDNMMLQATINAGKEEVFVGSNSIIKCYDGLTLSLKYYINVANEIKDFKVKNNILYILTPTYSIKTYDLSTKAFLNEKQFLDLGFMVNYNLLTGNNSGYLYLKYNKQSYSSQTTSPIYKNYVAAFNLVNGLPANSTVLDISAFNTDTLDYGANYDNIQLSPDGNYITCNLKGDVYSVNDKTIHNIKTINNDNPSVIYSNGYILGKTCAANGITFNYMDIFSVPGFIKVASIKSQNGTGYVAFADDFIDNDTLVSCNVKQGSQGNQVTNLLTFSFLKIN